ncbi:MAG: SMP-30/gluconolactonase/LRE family protein [Gammaproteobacteria bacterium]|nr:SMP-30/gluconolactonase/LRE family protein [Gammaproteobacteria bacterium]
MRRWVLRLILAATFSGFFANAYSQGLDFVETDDLRLLYFNPTESYLAPYAASTFHNSLAGQRKVFGYDPDDKVTVLLADFADHGNAGAYPVPRNRVLVDIAPRPPTFETTAPAERMYSWMNHELVHLVTTDQANSGDKMARRFFLGKIGAGSEHPESILYAYLTNPRLFSPRWYHEGAAVFVETWMAGGLGRAQGAYDEMVFRAMVRDDAHFYDPLGLVAVGTKVDFQVGVNAYLYGTRFMSFVAYHWSPEKLTQWVTRQEGSRRSYAAEFERVFGMPLNDAWQLWIEHEHQFQQQNLALLRQYPITPQRNLSARGLGSVSRCFHDDAVDKLYCGFRFPGTVAHVGSLSLDDGSIDHLEDIKGPMLYRVTALARDPEAGTLFYTADNYAYRDLMALDPATGKSEVLLRDARIGELAFNPGDRSLWGVRHLNGLAALVRIPYPYKEWNLIHSFPYGTSLYDMDVSPDGRLLSSSFGNVQGEQSFRVMRIDAVMEGKMTPVHEFDFGQAIPEGFVFSPDGKYLYGSSYYTGVSNIWRFELATGEREIVSNADAGFFRPLPLEDGSLIIFHYTGEGFVPAVIDPEPLQDVGTIRFFGTDVIDRHPQLSDWQAGSPADIDLESLQTAEGTYIPFANLGVQSAMPIIEGYKDSVAFGVNAQLSDPILFDTVDASISYSPDSDLASEERIHVNFEYRHVSASPTPLAGTWKLTARHNYANFYDLFGPTKRSLKGQSVGIGYEKTLTYDQPRKLDFEIDLTRYLNLDRLPRYQNVDTTFEQLTTLTAGLHYSHVKKSLGAVDDEKGFKWRIVGAANHVSGETIPKLFGNFDVGIALPWKNSSLWLRNSAGVAWGDFDDEFANFFFGGFGNNYVDSGDIKRYRLEYAMPGFELNEVSGRNFYRSMIELNLPPLRFRSVGTPGFYLTWARPAIFATTLTTNNDESGLRRNVSSVGAQIDFRFTIMSNLDMTLSVGYAAGFGDAVDSADEFMMSLKIL